MRGVTLAKSQENGISGKRILDTKASGQERTLHFPKSCKKAPMVTIK